MAYTFGNAISDVASNINQDLSDDTKTVTATEVKRWLNIAYRTIQNAVINSGQDYYLQEAYANLVASQNDYALPSDTLKLLRVEIGYESSSDRQVAQKVDLNFIREDNYTGGTANPFFAVHKNLIRLFPTPSLNVTAGLRIFYYPQVAELSNTSSTFDIPLGYEYLPMIFASAQAKKKLGLFDEAETFDTEFYREIERMKIDLVERVEDNNNFVRVVTDY